MRTITRLLLFFLFLQALAANSAAAPAYEKAYRHDRLWPSHVKLSEDLLDAGGQRVADKGIPLVMIRAYEDGKLAVVDRAGTFLVEYSQTDFLEQVTKFEEKNIEAGDAANFLHQIGRRVFDLSSGSGKAVSEAELARFEAFLICRTSSEKAELETLLSEIAGMKPRFERDQIEPILVFREVMTNLDFYEHLKAFEVGYPVVVPVFQRGFMDAIFTERESDMDFLLINKNGKLIRAANSLTAAMKLTPGDAHPTE